MDENFLLQTPLSRRLYHGCAEKLPVIDYHNHLNIRELAEGTNYPDLARLWLISDRSPDASMTLISEFTSLDFTSSTSRLTPVFFSSSCRTTSLFPASNIVAVQALPM